MKPGRLYRSRLMKAWDHLGADQEIFVVFCKPVAGKGFVFLESAAYDSWAKELSELIDDAFTNLYAERAGQFERDGEAVLRIFTDEAEAEIYLMSICTFLNVEDTRLEVVRLKLIDLYIAREQFLERTKTEWGIGLRFDVSRAQVEISLPETVDIVWSSEQVLS